MKKKKILSLLLASVMIGQTFPVGKLTTSAAEDSLVGKEQLSDTNTAAPKKDDVLPNANQYEYQKQELAAFCHFGPNTFNEIEWGENYGDKTPDEIFKLEEDFDADTFVKTIKEAGFKKLIVTAKHHDGFCIWASDYTKYDVSETSYKGGKGDILEELSAACTEYDVDMGLYLSPWDIHDDSYGYYDKDGKPTTKDKDVLDYNDYYNNQLEEILSNNKYGNKGHFKEVWMDGAKGSGANAQDYDFKRWFATIQKYEGKQAGYESDCMLFGAEAYTTVRWIGNELGYANEETWSKSKVDYDNNTIDSKKVGAYTVGYEDGNQWTVPESDARITSGWFWGITKNTPKSVEDLAGMYFNSVGHNSPLLLNIPPNDKGKVDDAILKRVAEFGKNIQDTFKENMAGHATVKASEVRGNDIDYSPENVLDGKDDTYWTVNDGTKKGSLVVELGETKTFDVVSIEEAIQFGQRIKEFKVEYSNNGESWKVFDQGTTIGAKRLSRENPVKADRLRITVTTSKEVPMISEVGVYKATTDFESPSAAPEGMQIIDERDEAFKFSDGWTQENASQSLNGTSAWAKRKGDSFEVKFKGSKIYLVGTVDPGHGKAKVTVDGKETEINTYASKRAIGQIIFTSEDLTDGEHTLKLEVSENNKAIGVEGAYVINNGGLGMIGVEKADYIMKEDSEMKIKLVRVGGTTGKATVTVAPNPGTAIQDDFDTEGTTTVTFEEGEKEKEVVVITRRNTKETGEQYFTEELSTNTENLIVGFNSKTKITILDQEGLPKEVTTKKLPKEAYQKATATSEETVKQQQGIAKAFDEDNNTFWHANWENGKLAENPDGISVEIPLDAVKELAKLTYLPRLEPEDAGTIGQYVIEAAVVKEDGKTAEAVAEETEAAVVEETEAATETALPAEGDETESKAAVAADAKTAAEETIQWKKVCEGTFKKQGSSKNPQEVVFPETVKTNRIRLTAKKMAGGEHPTAAEIALHEKTEPVLFTITAKAGEHGSIQPVTGALDADGKMQIQAGKLKTFAMKPEAGYVVDDVKVDNQSVGAVSRYTVESNEESPKDVTIEATFKACEHANTEIQGKKAATCTEDGATGKEVCLDCGVTVKESEVIPAHGHKFGDWEVTKEPTHTEEGKAERTCSVCSTVEEKTLAKLPMNTDKSKLQKYYDECIGYYKQSDYTADSWKAYEVALKDAKAILDKDGVTQEEIDTAINKLADAAKKLVKKTDSGNASDQSENTPVTGDPASAMLWLATAASAVAVIGNKKKK
ncbi:MAG: alpha-L-fucosidase [Lachnospiraceae bacterium]|nr:alpha-L-fucosidase [Lachnospiraceae bacterium]